MLRSTTHSRRVRKPWQSSLVLLGCITVSAYFMHHAINGRYGLEAQTRLVERSAQLIGEIRNLRAVHARLQRDNNLLLTKPPSRDMIEEIARRDLGYGYPGDIVIRLK